MSACLQPGSPPACAFDQQMRLRWADRLAGNVALLCASVGRPTHCCAALCWRVRAVPCCGMSQARLGQILLKVTRESTMTALDYVKAVQAAGQAAGPAAGSVVATPVKQVRAGVLCISVRDQGRASWLSHCLTAVHVLLCGVRVLHSPLL